MAQDPQLTASPATLAATRAFIVAAKAREWRLSQADVQGAYLHAELGGPPTYARLPPRFLSTDGKLMRRPLRRLLKALYGLKRAGADWDRHLHQLLLGLGWRSCQEVQPRLYHREGAALLVYVDDLIMAAPPETDDKLWGEIMKAITVQEVTQLGEFVGTCFYERGTNVHLMQKATANAIVADFERAFQVLPRRRAPLPVRAADQTDEDDKSIHADKCRSFVGRLLWLARCCRPDLKHAVGQMSRNVDNWRRSNDDDLEHTISYLKTTNNFNLKLTVGNPCHIVVYSDADFASKEEKRKSTSGWTVYVVNKDQSRALIDWGSNRQSCVALSTMEAELAAGAEGVKAGLRAKNVMALLGVDLPIQWRTDSQAAMGAVIKGYSAATSHRRPGAFISFLQEWVGDAMKYVPTADNDADLLTKRLPAVAVARHRLQMGIEDAGEYLMTGTTVEEE